MEKEHNHLVEYRIRIVYRLATLAPVVGLCAALVFTVSYLFGLFKNTSLLCLGIFDFINLGYIFVSAYVRWQMNSATSVSQTIAKLEIVLCFFIILQWNLISYFFPSREFWAYAPLFVLLVSYFFDKKIIYLTEGGICVSILVSWFLCGAELLPLPGPFYYELLVLRFVCIIITFALINFLTFSGFQFAEKVIAASNDVQKQNDEILLLNQEILDFTVDMIEQRDNESGEHVKRVKELTRLIAMRMMNDYPEYQLTAEEVEYITLAAPLHDVGKIKISDQILNKPGKLTAEEFAIMKTHTTAGVDIIERMPKQMNGEYLRFCRQICLYHHEKYDGSGYPLGLSGEQIPVAAQIVSVVDCYDALTSKRSYKEAYSKQRAIEMITNGECGVFSPKILAAFQRSLTDVE